MKFFYDVGAIVRFHTVISTPPCLYSPNQRRKRMKLVFILQCLILLNALCFLDLASGEDSKTSKEKDEMRADIAALKLTMIDQAKEIKELKSKASLTSSEHGVDAAVTGIPNPKATASEKTAIATFYAELNTNFFAEMTYITLYSSARENHNNCFNVNTGFFTAPVKGVYTFFFSGVKMKYQIHAGFPVHLNGQRGGHAKLTVSMRRIHGAKTDVIATGHVNSFDNYGWFPLTIQTIISLEAKDHVGVFLEEGFLFGQHTGEKVKPVGSGFISFSGYFLHY